MSEEIMKCIKCSDETDMRCENCEAPLCFGCDLGEFEDVLVCADIEGCTKRIEIKEAHSPTEGK